MITVIGSGAGADAGSWAGEPALVVDVRGDELTHGELDLIDKHAAEGGTRVVVRAGGDPGFFGVVRTLERRFGAQSLEVRPGPAAVGVAFARLGLAWDDALVADGSELHENALDRAVNVCRAHPKVAVLPGPGVGPAELGAELLHRVTSRTLVVFSALGDPFRERFERVEPAEAMCRTWEGVSLVLCLDESRAEGPAPAVTGPLRGPGRWALADREFGAADGSVLPYEARALALARLGPRVGDLIWDIGTGCGSVAVECARLGAAAVAVEKTASGVERIRANTAAHGVEVRAVHGAAPTVLSHLADPDGVFVGGGGRELKAIVLTAARRARRAVVVAVTALEQVTPVRSALESCGFAAEGVLLQSQRLLTLPDGSSSMAPAAPVFLVWGVR
ncbi:bifunctional cobalt-precorrin-7 (C(5))-methyltransferase/cobalt-precorrin-6B (C(15))-methyltransferase [Streptomyces sp. ISL-36]|uniref:bifunctional cobalt-precorrin-7 (C(5))-methyltransferase/cobalt-precorrin-6B (C(15))-methyltransferase n=1 Tax=Streptomyces sp. ISL-36 TaxID=2819182 RepID=UPI001BEC3236|nr:SAM-dependent methyltransferase [Streptomyces sp. ISL-36]MBT2443370.1 bifunctional cobalt-precorrin-7 (C(5))-methyltransferase/cobalt-precorrin-6B (C(15))-methyltransferase [Streptomyces sp. ISL-36]